MTKFNASSLARRMATLVFGLLLVLPVFSAIAAEEGPETQHAGNDLSDRASLQRGAKLYMNYCAGCHSMKYLRYSRMADDLGLSEEEVMTNLNLTGAKYGEQIQTAMTEEHAKQFFGKMPPDLSVESRVRGSDWIYSYLKSFYQDPTRPLGWNNTIYVNASMPNPLWELQGLQRPVLGKKNAQGDRPVERLELASPGTHSAVEFDQTARDITNFLEYAGEPAALKRQSLGVWVILFLAFFTFLAWLLKTEYWKDVH